MRYILSKHAIRWFCKEKIDKGYINLNSQLLTLNSLNDLNCFFFVRLNNHTFPIKLRSGIPGRFLFVLIIHFYPISVKYPLKKTKTVI